MPTKSLKTVALGFGGQYYENPVFIYVHLLTENLASVTRSTDRLTSEPRLVTVDSDTRNRGLHDVSPIGATPLL